MKSKLITAKEAAVQLRLETSTLAKYRLTGEGPAYVKYGKGRGGRVFYHQEDIDSWLATRRRKSTSDSGYNI